MDTVLLAFHFLAATVEAETSAESASHPKEPPTTPERLDDVPQVLNLVENGNKQETGHTSNMSTDFAPETILEHDKRAEEVGLEKGEVLHSEGNQKEEVTGSLTNVGLLDGDEGTSTETTLMESDRNGPANQVEEGHTDGRNGLFDKMKETLRSDKPNHQPRHDGVPILDRASSEETGALFSLSCSVELSGDIYVGINHYHKLLCVQKSLGLLWLL